MNFDVNKEITRLNKYRDPDMSNEAQEFYNNYFPWFNYEGMRGDTICSFSTCFGACNKKTSKELIVLNDGPNWKRGYTKELFNEEKARENILIFRKRYHSLANFWVMPQSLNLWRGMRDRNGNLPAQADFFDVFLECVRNYYINRELNQPNVRHKFEDENITNWLNDFGCGLSGWYKFITRNYLSMFVTEDDLLVKDIFGSNFKTNIADIIGTYHEYGRALPQQTKLQPIMDSVKNYIDNSLWILEERGSQLLKAKIN